jgi:hypothetical protein
MIPLKEKAEIRVEYGDENFFPSLYHVACAPPDTESARA